MEIEFLENSRREWRERKRTSSKEVKQKERGGWKNKTARRDVARSGLLSEGEQALTCQGCETGRGNSDRGRGTKLENATGRGLTVAASGTINVCAPLSHFSSKERREGRSKDTRFGDRDESDRREFDDSNSRFNRVFNWATMNQWSLFSRGFASRSKRGEKRGGNLDPRPPPLFNLGIDPCGRLRGYTSLISAPYQPISYPMEFINLDLSADNCGPSLSLPSCFNEIYLLFYATRRVPFKGELFSIPDSSNRSN